MSTRKATPIKPLEGIYNIKQAAVKLGLAKDEQDTRGHRFLRKGVNRPQDGSEGPQFPHFRMNGQLQFSDSDLVFIASLFRNVPDDRGRIAAGGVRKRAAKRTTARRTAAAKSKPNTGLAAA